MVKKQDVKQFIDALEHPLKKEVEALCEIIRSARSGITERIKWNAPSFCFQGDDRVTLKLMPQDKVYLIFHRGAKVKDSKGFAFEDKSGLLKFLAKDRALAAFAGMQEILDNKAALKKLVRQWMEATVDDAVAPKRVRRAKSPTAAR
jgi:uncharacterized protein YdeI (YjbR/CyaY-like superfamily)